MRFRWFLSFVFLLSGFWTVHAYAQTAETHFRTGIAAFQKGDLNAARAAFIESLQLDDSSPATLFNLGLTEQKLGKTGLAIALWRKALAHEPNYSPAKSALNWAKTHLERSEVRHNKLLWESFRGTILQAASLSTFLIFTAIALLIAGWSLLGYFGARRRALLDEKPVPPLRIRTIAYGVLLLVFSSLTAAKAIDMQTLRGTILPKKVEVRSTPDPSGTELFDLYEGLEVIIRQTTGDWAQVTYPGGATGWIPKQAVFSTSDKVAL